MERDHSQSLLESDVGRSATVRVILFEGLRERCAELGLREGDRLVVDGRERESLVLRRGTGVPIRCPVELARFVEVEGQGWNEIAANGG
jgi:hypothetical protein